MEHEAQVFFAVFEFGQDAQVVTQLAGFEPTEAWVVGQPMQQQSTVTHRFSRWTFKSPLPLSAPIEDHLASLVTARFPAHIAIATYFRTFTPGFHLPQQLLARVAALGLGIDFDLYFLGQDDERDEQRYGHPPP